MIYELNKADYEKVRPLFQPLAYQLMSVVVLDGARPGQVFVDDPTDPQTAFAFTPGMWGYLAGDPNNGEFNRALREAIRSKTILERVGSLFLVCDSDGWWESLPGVFGLPPIPFPRRYYVCRELAYGWQANVPEGFAVRRIDEALLNRPGLGIPDGLRDWMDEQGSQADFLERSFGFATVHGDEIVSWALSDGVSGDTTEIGIHTAGDFRRRGLAAITTAATVEHALARGLSKVNWQCADDNVASIRTAEKVGFVKERDYMMYVFFKKEADHRSLMRTAAADFAEKGEEAFKSGRYRESIEFYGWVFALLDDVPSEHYHLVARAWAALGERERAVECLEAATHKGWGHLAHTRLCKEFKCLHDAPEWSAVLERIERNRRELS